MKAKKLIASLLAMSMTAAAAGLAVQAADTVTISVGNATAAAGETFTVDVSLSGIPATGACAVDFAVEFDSSLVTITDVTTGALCDTGAASAEGNINADLADTTFDWNVADNLVCLTWTTGLLDSNYWLKDSGVFVTITGTVNADATAGSKAAFNIVPVDREVLPGSTTMNQEILVGYVDDSLVDHNYTTATKTGYVTVAGAGDDAVYGDVNCDGEVTIADVVMLSRYVAEDTELRNKLREANVTYMVIKNKILKRAVEEVFGVKVADVKTIRTMGKNKRVGVHVGKRADLKKAVVTLTEDSKTIEFFDGMQ